METTPLSVPPTEPEFLVTRPDKFFLIRKVDAVFDEDCNELPPHPRAKRYKITFNDVRTTDDPKEIGYRHDAVNWYKEGTNHRMYKGRICRDKGTREVWGIFIKDLFEFVKEVDEPVTVLHTDWDHIEFPEVIVG